jgi:hypothetical protein
VDRPSTAMSGAAKHCGERRRQVYVAGPGRRDRFGRICPGWVAGDNVRQVTARHWGRALRAERLVGEMNVLYARRPESGSEAAVVARAGGVA